MSKINELEIYSPIVGFPDYLVTSHGRVLSLKFGKIKELKPFKNSFGYLSVDLLKNGTRYNNRVHRLVAKSFIPNTENKTEVNHIDEDKTNNRVSNLEWITRKENINYGTHNQRSGKTRSKKVIAKSLTESKVLVFKSAKQAEKFGFTRTNITSCCRKQRKSHKGYQWFYLESYNREVEK